MMLTTARQLHIPSLISMPCADTDVCPHYPSESSEAQQAAFGLTRSGRFQRRTKCQEQSDRLESYPGRAERTGARRKDKRAHEIPFGHRDGCESVFWLGGIFFFSQGKPVSATQQTAGLNRRPQLPSGGGFLHQLVPTVRWHVSALQARKHSRSPVVLIKPNNPFCCEQEQVLYFFHTLAFTDVQ